MFTQNRFTQSIVSDESLKDELKEMTFKLQMKEDELDTLLSTLSKLETENLDLSQGKNKIFNNSVINIIYLGILRYFGL